MTKLSIIIFLLFTTISTFGQTVRLSIKRIDSIVHSIDTTKQLKNTIIDGTLTPKGRRKPKGGFSDTYLLSSRTQHLVKVEHEQSLFFKDYTTYYFFNDSLIFVKTSRYNLSGDTKNKISNGHYYFVNDILMNKKEQGKPASKTDAFINRARQYLTDVNRGLSL